MPFPTPAKISSRLPSTFFIKPSHNRLDPNVLRQMEEAHTLCSTPHSHLLLSSHGDRPRITRGKCKTRIDRTQKSSKIKPKVPDKPYDKQPPNQNPPKTSMTITILAVAWRTSDPEPTTPTKYAGKRPLEDFGDNTPTENRTKRTYAVEQRTMPELEPSQVFEP